MRNHVSFFFSLVAGASLAAPGAFAEEEHRELGAHVHGHGTFNIAVEGNRVDMELEAPGMDIVGFEHEASSDDQKAVVEKAKSALAQPLELFKIPAAAGCKVAKADVALESEHEHGDDHDEDHDDRAKGEDHDHDEHADADHDDHDHDHEHHHSAFHVTYSLDCTKPSSLSSITFDYFKKFAGAQTLTVNVVTAKAQSSYEVSRDKSELDLGGMM